MNNTHIHKGDEEMTLGSDGSRPISACYICTFGKANNFTKKKKEIRAEQFFFSKTKEKEVKANQRMKKAYTEKFIEEKKIIFFSFAQPEWADR